MATSVAPTEDALGIPPERRQAIAAAIAALDEQGVAITYNQVHTRVGGARKFVTRYIKAWREQQHTAVPVVDGAPEPPPVPAPPPAEPPVTHLVRLRQQVAQLEAEVRELEQTLQQRQQQLAQGRANYRNDVFAARRLVQDCWQVLQLAGSPAYFMDATMVEKAARLRQAFVDLVGEQDVAASLADMRYSPWWMHD